MGAAVTLRMCPREQAGPPDWLSSLPRGDPQLLVPTGHLHAKLEPGSGAVGWDSQISSLCRTSPCCTSLGALRASLARHKIVLTTPPHPIVPHPSTQWDLGLVLGTLW